MGEYLEQCLDFSKHGVRVEFQDDTVVVKDIAQTTHIDKGSYLRTSFWIREMIFICEDVQNNLDIIHCLDSSVWNHQAEIKTSRLWNMDIEG